MEGTRAELCSAIEKLLGYAKARLFLHVRNECYARNTVLGILGLETFEKAGAQYEGESAAQLLDTLCRCGERAGLFQNEDFERIQDGVMGALMLLPDEVDRRFLEKMNAPAEAMKWLYDYSVASDYVKKHKLDQNPRFTAENGLIVTINTAKPEFRDPKKAARGNATAGGYPACSICRDNEGYFGRNKRTLRTVSLTLGGKQWFWQFSPYGYFREHGIAVNESHTPMHVDEETFRLLMDFVDLFPNYFLGCNAPLPRIGGSVLAHDHFQGGGETLPLFLAGDAVRLSHPQFPGVQASVLDWFGTAIRLVSCDRDAIALLADRIRRAWEEYEDRARGLVPYDKDGAHNAVSPTVMKTSRGYEMNLILRSNATSERYPDGIFHAHPEFHVIKKESIGLIEAQGLFILPGRLVSELAQLREAIVAGALPASLEPFRLLYDEITAGAEGSWTTEGAQRAIERELGSICERILQNTAVFPTHGETADFLRRIGFHDRT